MLSIENSPPDPSCPCEISQLKSGSDERDSDKVALQEVDLLESGSECLGPGASTICFLRLRCNIISRKQQLEVTNGIRLV